MKASSLRPYVILLAAMAVTACGGRSTNLEVNQSRPIPSEPVVTRPYTIGALDVLRIDTFGEPDLTIQSLPVDTGGNISLPLVGTIRAEGLTARQLADQITTGLNRYLVNPQVSVNVTEFISQKITISGAVTKPGVYQAPGRTTLMDALAIGGGGNDYAKLSEIIVYRRSGGQQSIARFDMGRIENGELADPVLQPGDVVVVGYSNARRLFRDALAVLPAAFGVFVTLANTN